MLTIAFDISVHSQMKLNAIARQTVEFTSPYSGYASSNSKDIIGFDDSIRAHYADTCICSWTSRYSGKSFNGNEYTA